MKNTTLVLSHLTEGQTSIQQAMAQRDEQHLAEVTAMRDAIAQLTAFVHDHLLI
jgi:hypothetical protein